MIRHLSEHEDLKPRLDALIKAHEEDALAASQLEERITSLLQRYTTRVLLISLYSCDSFLIMVRQTDSLSELFVEWNNVISSMEDKVNRMERDKQEQVKLGYE